MGAEGSNFLAEEHGSILVSLLLKEDRWGDVGERGDLKAGMTGAGLEAL